MQKQRFFYRVLSIHFLCIFIIWCAYQLFPQAIPDTQLNDVEIVSSTTTLPTTEDIQPLPNEFATSTVFFTGDVMLARHVEYLLTKNGTDYSFRNLDFLLAEPAYVVGNFEASIPDNHKKTPDFGYTSSVDKKFIPTLKAAGFTHVSLANNHSYDTGGSGFLNTKEVLASSSIIAFGQQEGLATSSLTHLTIRDKSIAILGIHTLVSIPNTTELSQFILTHASTSDLVIAYVHWGTEYERAQSNWQRTFAQQLVLAGVDVIIGHHPHVVQGVEKIGNSIVFYSLGNLIFDQYFSTDVQEGLVLKMVAVDNGFEFEFFPVMSVGSPAQPRAIVGSDRASFLETLATYSDKKLKTDILAGRIFMHIPLATSTEMSIMNR